MKKHLDDLFAISQFSHSMRGIERLVTMPESERLENNAEHSFHLSLLAWYIVKKHRLKLDMAKVLSYCIVHDLVEIYAGDTFVFDDKRVTDKVEREAAALVRIA